MKTRTIAILGATGSIGTQALDIVRRYPERFRADCLTAHGSAEKLFDLCREFRPRFAALVNEPEEIPGDLAAARRSAPGPALEAACAGDAAARAWVCRTEEGAETLRPVRFRHSAGAPDDLEQGIYSNSIYRWDENSIMNLGHGRAGHLPDYSFIRYKYLPAWGGYEEIVKDNPDDYFHAFGQMVHALKVLRGSAPVFTPDFYEPEAVAPWAEEIRAILCKRRPDACEDWKALGEKLAGRELEDFDLEKYTAEYLAAGPEEKDATFLGAFFIAALAQKSMVTNAIFRSGNLCAGFSVDFAEKGFRGIRDFRKLMEKEGRS